MELPSIVQAFPSAPAPASTTAEQSWNIPGRESGIVVNPFLGRPKVLAPLVGGSDLSFRLLARQYGAQVTYTEMCIAEYLLRTLNGDRQKLKQYSQLLPALRSDGPSRYTYEFHPSDRPLILQLGGCRAEPIIELVNFAMFKDHVDMVDLNCGCPQNFALERGYGAALLRDADHLVDMCKEIAAKIPYPLSVKCRLHEDVATTIATLTRLHRLGVNTFTVHGRYFWQRGPKRGQADWDAIREIKRALPDITLIGNGDIGKHEDFQRMLDHTGCDAAMAGYGALINPSIFQADPAPLASVIESYLHIARQHKNKLVSVLRHLAWMLKSYRIQPDVKAKLFTCRSMEDIRLFLAQLDPPILVRLGEVEKEAIVYPKSKAEMTPAELRKLARGEEKTARKHAKRAGRVKDLDSMEDLIAG